LSFLYESSVGLLLGTIWFGWLGLLLLEWSVGTRFCYYALSTPMEIAFAEIIRKDLNNENGVLATLQKNNAAEFRKLTGASAD
jgi:hypothetical protein